MTERPAEGGTGAEPGTRSPGAPTVRDIAIEAGVSIATVSRSLSGHPDVKAGTREHVQAAALRLGYSPNAIARALRQQRTATVGLVVPNIESAFYASSATVIQRTLNVRGYKLILSVHNDDAELEERYVRDLLSWRVDGIIHVPSSPEGVRILHEPDDRLPVVELARRSQAGASDAVTTNEREGAERLTRHLLELGHRRIAILTGSERVSTGRRRVEGYAAALAAAGIELDRGLVLPGQFTEAWGERAMRRLAEAPVPPTAVFAAGNRIAVGVLKALAGLGWRCPGDISFVAFEDPSWFAFWRPAITTFALPLEEMGVAAVELLFARLAAPRAPGEPGRTRELAGELRLRASAGPPPAARP